MSILCKVGNAVDSTIPAMAPPIVAKSGSIIVSMSTKVQKIISEAKIIYAKARDGGKEIHNSKKITAVILSTKGYLIDILEPQQLALPRKNSQDKIGMLQYHFMGVPHLQCDGGLAIDSPFGILNMQTFRKLPIQAPMQKAKICIINGKFFAVSIIVIVRELLT